VSAVPVVNVTYEKKDSKKNTVPGQYCWQSMNQIIKQTSNNNVEC